MPPNRIRELRQKAALSQGRLGEMVGCSHVQISELERGEAKLSNLWMQRLAEPLGVKPADLMNLEDGALTVEERSLLRLFHSLDEIDRRRMVAILEIMQNTAPVV